MLGAHEPDASAQTRHQAAPVAVGWVSLTEAGVAQKLREKQETLDNHVLKKTLQCINKTHWDDISQRIPLQGEGGRKHI